MKKPKQGPSLYYASDKNIFDAVNQSKVDNDTVQNLFERRNIVCSKKTPRSDLANYFSQLTHDYLDHQDISNRLGIAKRRERLTSIDLSGVLEKDQISCAVENLVKLLSVDGDTVQVSKNGASTYLTVQYSEIDYKRSEFSQVQHRDGQLELTKEGDGYVLRSTQSEYMNEVRDELISQLQAQAKTPLHQSTVSLLNITSPSVRSKFFYDLIVELPGYVRRDVTDVFVYKAKPEGLSDADDESDEDGHIERVLMRGSGVSQSKLLNSLVGEGKYHISKVGWIATEKMGKGFGYEIEAMFNDPKDCTGFSYLLRGVYILEENGRLSRKRRSPTPSEVEIISRAVESKARELMKRILFDVETKGAMS